MLSLITKFLEKALKTGWFRTVAALCLLLISLVFVYWPILIGQVSFRGDGVGHIQLFFSYGIKHFIANLGVLPNWWAQFDSGYPGTLTGNGFLNPIFLLVFRYLPVFLAFHWLNIILLFLGGASLYWLARNLQMSRLASLISALTFCFSGIIVKYTELTIWSTLYPVIPLLFLALLKIFNGRRRWYFILFLLTAYSFIGGSPELPIYFLFCLSFFFVFLCFRHQLKWKEVVLKILAIGLAFVSAFLVLLPWLLPVFYFISLSMRAGSLDIGDNNYGTGLAHLLQMFNPHIEVFYGQLLPIQMGVSYDLFVGVMSLLLVLVAVFFGGLRSSYAKFFGGLGLFTLLVSITNSPVYWLIHKLPLMEKFRWQFKWSFITVFVLALLAGFGADALKNFWQSRRNKFFLVPIWFFLILFLGMTVFLTVYGGEVKMRLIQYGGGRYSAAATHSLPRSPDYYQFIVSQMAGSLVDELSFKNDKVLLMLILWIVSAGVLTIGRFSWFKTRHQKLQAAVLIMVVLGLVLPWKGKVTGPEARYFTEPPETAKFLHSIDGYSPAKLPLSSDQSPLAPYRLFVYTPDQYFAELTDRYRDINFQDFQNQHWFRRELIASNRSIIYDFDTVFNGEPLVWGRWPKVRALARRQPEFKDIKLQDTPFSEFLNEFSTTSSWRFLGMLNVKYVTSLFELPQRGQSIFTSRVLDNRVPIYVYENPFFQPRWYFAKEIKLTEAKGDDAVFEEFKKIDDSQKLTLIEASSSNDLALSSVSKFSDKDKINMQEYTNGYLKLSTNTQGYRWLVFSETKEPFWRAKINGQSVPLYAANYVYQAVLVPPGKNNVEFYYPNFWQQPSLAFFKLFFERK